MVKVWRCTPCGSQINYDTALNLECATEYLKAQGCEVQIGMQSGTFVDHTHNLAAYRFLQTDAEFLWWIDSDMLFPMDTGVRLLNCASAIAGVVYRRRMVPHDLMGLKRDKGLFCREDEGIVDALQLGTGCLMVHRSVYTGMKYPWYENLYGDRPEDFEGGDTVFVRRAVEAGHSCKAELYVSRDVYHTGVEPLGWFDFDDTDMRARPEHYKQTRVGAYHALGATTHPTPIEAVDKAQEAFSLSLNKVKL